MQPSMRTARSSSPTVQGLSEMFPGRPGRPGRPLTPSRPLPPRSPTISVSSVAQGSSRPPRSPPAVTGRANSPLPSPSFGFPDLQVEETPPRLAVDGDTEQTGQTEQPRHSRRASPQLSISSALSEAEHMGAGACSATKDGESNLVELEAATAQLEAKHAELEQSILHSEALQETLAGRRSLLVATAQRQPAPEPAGLDSRTNELHAEIVAKMQEEERQWRKRLQVERRKAAAAALRAVAQESSEHEDCFRQEMLRAEQRAQHLEEELSQALLAPVVEELSNAAPARRQLSNESKTDDKAPEASSTTERAVQVEEISSTVENLEAEVEALRQQATELPRLRSLLEAAEKRLSKNDENAELERIQSSLRDQNQMAILSAMQGAKDTEDMLRSALAAETTCQLMAESEAERAKAASDRAHELLQDLVDAGRNELLALRALMQEEMADSSGRLAEAQEALHLAGEAEEAMVKLGEEELSAAGARAELSQERVARALELEAATWFYFAETRGWSEAESTEAQLMVASRQEELQLLDQRDASIHAATTEASALRAEAAAVRKEALGLRHDLGKEEVACQQMKLLADRARAAESATLRSALTEVRAEAARGVSILHRAEDAEKELRRLRLEQAQKEVHLKDLTHQLFDAERRATAAVTASTIAMGGGALAISNADMARRERVQSRAMERPGPGHWAF